MTVDIRSAWTRHASAIRCALLGVAFAAGGLLLAAAGWRDLDTAERLFVTATSGRARAEAALRDTSAALEEHGRVQPVLLELERRRAIGDEQRLAWLERLDALARPLPGRGMSWRFMPRRSVDPSILDADAGTLEVTSSRQTLDLSVRHEGQLLDLLDELVDTAPALVRIQRCALSPDPADAQGALGAQCTLDWITFRPRVQP